MLKTSVNQDLEKQLRNISWNNASLFPASHYIIDSLRTLGCSNVSLKFQKQSSSGAVIHIQYICNDFTHHRSFATQRDIKGRKKDIVYSWLLNSAIFKSHCLLSFHLSLPLPNTWDIDGLVLESNDWFTDCSSANPSNIHLPLQQLQSMNMKITNLESKVQSLSLRISELESTD